MSIFDKFRHDSSIPSNPQEREPAKFHEDPIETIRPEEIKGNLPELNKEELEKAKQAFLEEMTIGNILVQAKAHRFFRDPKKQDNRQLSKEDLGGTGLSLEDLAAEKHGEQPLFLPQFTNAYKK